MPKAVAQRRTDDPVLPCPECRDRGRLGHARIGNRKSDCGTCNRFGQAVRRTALKLLRQKHEDEYRGILLLAEREVYRQVLDEWLARTQDGIQ